MKGLKVNDIFIDRDWFKIWTRNNYPLLTRDNGIKIITSLYSSYFLDDSEGESNGPYTVALTFGIFNSPEKKTGKLIKNIILYSMLPPALLDPNQLITHARNLCRDYFNNSTKESYEGGSPDVMIVPAIEGSRNTIISEITKDNVEVPIKRFYHDNYGKTLDNMLNRALPKIIQGRVWVAAKPGSYVELRNTDEKLLFILSGYPEIESRGAVWALAQAILFLETNRVFKDEGETDNRSKIKQTLYGV